MLQADPARAAGPAGPRAAQRLCQPHLLLPGSRGHGLHERSERQAGSRPAGLASWQAACTVTPCTVPDLMDTGDRPYSPYNNGISLCKRHRHPAWWRPLARPLFSRHSSTPPCPTPAKFATPFCHSACTFAYYCLSINSHWPPFSQPICFAIAVPMATHMYGAALPPPRHSLIHFAMGSLLFRSPCMPCCNCADGLEGVAWVDLVVTDSVHVGRSAATAIDLLGCKAKAAPRADCRVCSTIGWRARKGEPSSRGGGAMAHVQGMQLDRCCAV